MYRILVNNALFCDSRIDDLAIVDPVVTLEVNSAGSFEFTIPHGHPKAELISGRTDIVTVERDGEIIIKAVPIETTEDFYGNIKVVCEGELTYLNDSILRQSHKQGLTVRQLLESYINEHNSQVEESKRFTVGSVTVSDDYITCYTNYNSTMQEIKEDLLDDLGGYLRVRYSGTTKYLDYLAESPHTSDQIIELGKNLMDYESNLDSTEIATIIIPLGATQEEQEVSGLDAYLTIKSVNDGKDYLESTTAAQYFGWITQVVHWDNVTTASALKSKGQAYLNDIQFDNVVLELSAVDFGALSDDIDSFHVLDKIRVVSAPHGMDKWFVLTKQTINLNNPENDRITLGKTEKKSLSTKVIQQNEEILKRIEQVPTSSAVKSAIDNATNLLRGAEGGHVKIVTNDDGKPDAILIMDTDDEETATKIWRWNLNGFGYSSDGGETYGLAMTMDGSIVADFITSGTINADLIKVGERKLVNTTTIHGNIWERTNNYANTYSKPNRSCYSAHGNYDDDGVRYYNFGDSNIPSTLTPFGRDAKGLMVTAETQRQDAKGAGALFLGDFVNNSYVRKAIYLEEGTYTASVYVLPYHIVSDTDARICIDVMECVSETDVTTVRHISYPSTNLKDLSTSESTRIVNTFTLDRGQYVNAFAALYYYPEPTDSVIFYGFKLEKCDHATDYIEGQDDIEVGGEWINGGLIEAGTVSCDVLNGGTINGQIINGCTITGTTVESEHWKLLDSWFGTDDYLFSITKQSTRESWDIYSKGAAWFEDFLISDSLQTGNITSSGTVKLSGAYSSTSSSSNWATFTTDGVLHRYASSSLRYKHDVSTELLGEYNPQNLYELPVVTFKYNDGYLSEDDAKCGKDILGFIAEEVHEHFPIACQYDAEGKPESWNAQVIVPALLKLIQEQKAEIYSIKERLRRLEETNE